MYGRTPVRNLLPFFRSAPRWALAQQNLLLHFNACCAAFKKNLRVEQPNILAWQHHSATRANSNQSSAHVPGVRQKSRSVCLRCVVCAHASKQTFGELCSCSDKESALAGPHRPGATGPLALAAPWAAGPRSRADKKAPPGPACCCAYCCMAPPPSVVGRLLLAGDHLRLVGLLLLPGNLRRRKRAGARAF